MFERSQEYILKDITQMISFLARREVKYRRNYNRFYNNFNRQEDINTVYGNIVSFYNQNDETVGSIPYLNILRSCVDTTASKLSQIRVRPFFNPVLGNYKTTKVCRNAQVYFDEFFDIQDIYKKMVNVITDALIFDMGVAWIQDATKSVKKLNPWEFIFDVGEMTQGTLTRCGVNIKQYPLLSLRNIIKTDSTYYQAMQTSPQAYVNLIVYYDLIGKFEYTYIGTDLIQTRAIDYEVPPFVWMYYKDPLKGAFSDSMIDVVYRIQKMIDDLTYKIATAAELSPANMVFVPKGSDLKTSAIAASKIGDVFEYTINPSGGAVSVVVPPIIDPQYIQLLEMFEQKAYNLVGISQLSAQAKKPSGLNSGVALQTMEDVESERHNVLQTNYIRLIRNLAERIIDIYPDGEELLPKRRGRSSISWKDIKKEREMFNIQYSASNSLSKDPKVKMEQIEKLISMKIIDPTVASTLLEMPDLEGAYSIVTAMYDFNEKIIERVIEDGPNPETGQFNYYEVTNINQLYSQTMNTLMRLDTNDEDPKVMQSLVAFLNQVKQQMDEINQSLTPPPPEQPPVPNAPPMVQNATGKLPLEAQPPIMGQ